VRDELVYVVLVRGVRFVGCVGKLLGKKVLHFAQRVSSLQERRVCKENEKWSLDYAETVGEGCFALCINKL